MQTTRWTVPMVRKFLARRDGIVEEQWAAAASADLVS
jgi:hypothetical protein